MRTIGVATLVVGFLPSLVAAAPAAVPRPKPTSKSVDRLVFELQSGDRHDRWLAARDLRECGSSAKSAVSDLAAAVAKDDDRDVAVMAVEALGAIGPDVKEVVPALIDALDHKAWEVRWSAANALYLIGPAASDAKEPLARLMNSDPDRDVRDQARRARIRLGGAVKQLRPVRTPPPSKGTSGGKSPRS